MSVKDSFTPELCTLYKKIQNIYAKNSRMYQSQKMLWTSLSSCIIFARALCIRDLQLINDALSWNCPPQTNGIFNHFLNRRYSLHQTHCLLYVSSTCIHPDVHNNGHTNTGELIVFPPPEKCACIISFEVILKVDVGEIGKEKLIIWKNYGRFLNPVTGEH